MKRILFVIPSLGHGGTNRSLLNIIDFMNTLDYEIEVYCISHIGPYVELLSHKILPEDIWLSSIFESYAQILREPVVKRIRKLVIKVLFQFLRIFSRKKMLGYVYKRVARNIDKMNYDYVVAMQEGITTHLLSHTRTSKIAWVHSDYVAEIRNVLEEEYYYSKYEQIVFVSNYTLDRFIKLYPKLTNRCQTIYNLLNEKTILRQASHALCDTRFDIDGWVILSIGRLSKVKRFYEIPEIAWKLKRKGFQFKWYIIGKGKDKELILEKIDEYEVADSVILLGEIDNPYPYIKHSKIVAVTSSSEACPYVLNEAKLLHVPIVATSFGSIQEFIIDGYNGFIADLSEFPEVIGSLMEDFQLYERLKQNVELDLKRNEQQERRIMDLFGSRF